MTTMMLAIMPLVALSIWLIGYGIFLFLIRGTGLERKRGRK